MTKRSSRQWRPYAQNPFRKRHTPWTILLGTQTAMMMQFMQGWEWRPDRDTKGWCLGSQPDLLIENQDDGPNRDNENSLEPPIAFCLFLRDISR